MNNYELIPGSIASLLYVRPPAYTGFSGSSIACVYVGKERGVVVGRFDRPLAKTDWPTEVQAQINKHFDIVFSLEHENWKGREPSPRAQYVEAAVPWEVAVSEELL